MFVVEEVVVVDCVVYVDCLCLCCFDGDLVVCDFVGVCLDGDVVGKVEGFLDVFGVMVC